MFCLYTCFRKQYKCTITLPPVFTAPNEWCSHNEHLFNILFSPLCSVCGLIPCLLHCVKHCPEQLPASFWPSLQGSAPQLFTNATASLSQQLEIMLCYYFNFTVGYGQTFQWGNEIFTKCRHPRHNTAPSQHSVCCKHGQLPQLAAAKLTRPQNLLSNTEAVRNVQSKTSHEKSGQVDSRHILQNCIFNTPKIPRLGDHFLSL